MTKIERYEKLIDETRLIMGTEGKYSPDELGRLSIACALLVIHFPDLVFAGFYLLKDNRLHIGPYQGKVIACTPIAIGKGVCGTCAESDETVIVNDVMTYPNYIACDDLTRSEIVLPVHKNNRLYGVLDLDAPVPNRFDDTDRIFLEQFLSLIFPDR